MLYHNFLNGHKAYRHGQKFHCKKFIQFATSESLAKLHRIWQIWYSDERPVGSIRAARRRFLKMNKADKFQNNKTHLMQLFGSYLSSKLTDSVRKYMKGELEGYFQNGFVLVEELLNYQCLHPHQ